MSKSRTRKSRLLTPREAAARIGVTPSTLAVWMREGVNLPADAAVRLPCGHRRYREEAIEAFRAVLEKGGAA